jgi:hypothetical protein
MTVRIVTKIHNYVGQSVDTKPTTGVEAGSTFHELDTGDDYVFSGVSWVIDTGATTTTAGV